jgi:hypothetical protein
MPAEQVVALRGELLEAGELVRRIAPIGEQRQLEPPLVRVVDRLKNSCGSAVWMNTGMRSRAAACQIGSSSGSSMRSASRRPS